MKKNILSREEGMILPMVMVFSLILALLSMYALTLSHNKNKLTVSVSSKGSQAYYSAQAGVVDAHWRMRTNYYAVDNPASSTIGNDGGTSPGSAPNNYFKNASWDPAKYYVSLENNTSSNTWRKKSAGDAVDDDMEINIGVATAGVRTMVVKGIDKNA